MSPTSSAPLSPAAAYRTDVKDAARLGDDDDLWLAVASSVHLATHSRPKQQRELLASATSKARRLLGAKFIADYSRIEWHGGRHRIAPLLVVAQQIQEAGGFTLAAVLLDDLLAALPSLDGLWRGRLLALRARIAWKHGLAQEAADRYDLIYGIGLRFRQPELQARAEIGRTALAQLSGNLPAVYSHAKRAARFAERARSKGVLRLAYMGLTIGYVGKRDHEAALGAAWKAYGLSIGFEVLEAEVLQNIGQIMLVTGHPAEARACFSSVLSRRVPDHVSLAALGALALASARIGAEPTVEWSVREIWRARSLPVPRYELANALLESAAALQLLGHSVDAERYREAAQPIATAHQYHELAFNAEQLAKDIARTGEFRRAETETIAERIRALDERLPAHVHFDAVES